MNTSKVINQFIDDYNVIIGDKYVPRDHSDLNVDVDGMSFRLIVNVDASDQTISCATLNFKTDDRNELIEAFKKLNRQFNLQLVLEDKLDFSNIHVLGFDFDDKYGVSVKLVLHDWITSIIPRYKVQLKIESE